MIINNNKNSTIIILYHREFIVKFTSDIVNIKNQHNIPHTSLCVLYDFLCFPLRHLLLFLVELCVGVCINALMHSK